MQATTSRPTRPATINVTVTFPISPNGPFHDRRLASETVGELREAAMRHFGVAADGQHVYYLTVRRRRVAETLTVGEIAAPARAARFTLAKELVQG